MQKDDTQSFMKSLSVLSPVQKPKTKTTTQLWVAKIDEKFMTCNQYYMNSNQQLNNSITSFYCT